MEQLKVFYSRAVPLEGVLLTPNGAGGSYPTVLLCHGHSRNKNDGLDELARVLAESGIASFRIDFRGCAGVAGRFDLLPGLNWRDDIDNALTFIALDERVDKERLGISGISMGGTMTIDTAARDTRIKCAAAMAPIGNLKRNFYRIWKTKLGPSGFEDMVRRLEEDRVYRVKTGISRFVSSGYICGHTGKNELAYLYENCDEQQQGRYNNNYVTLEGMDDTLKLAPEDEAHKVTAPTLLLHGTADDIVDKSESERLLEKLGCKEKELYMVEGSEHNIPRDPHRQLAFEKIARWFKQYL